MSLFGCKSIYQPVMHTWKQTKAAAWSESEQGLGAGALRFPPQLMLGFLASISLFSTCKLGVAGVCVCGGEGVWEAS